MSYNPFRFLTKSDLCLCISIAFVNLLCTILCYYICQPVVEYFSNCTIVFSGLALIGLVIVGMIEVYKKYSK